MPRYTLLAPTVQLENHVLVLVLSQNIDSIWPILIFFVAILAFRSALLVFLVCSFRISKFVVLNLVPLVEKHSQTIFETCLFKPIKLFSIELIKLRIYVLDCQLDIEQAKLTLLHLMVFSVRGMMT